MLSSYKLNDPQDSTKSEFNKLILSLEHIQPTSDVSGDIKDRVESNSIDLMLELSDVPMIHRKIDLIFKTLVHPMVEDYPVIHQVCSEWTKDEPASGD